MRPGRPARALRAVPGPVGDPSARVADELLVRVARGDEAAFAQLYDLLVPRVYGLCRRLLRDPAQSEEVAQEVLLEIWRSAARFDPAQGRAETWILTITHRRAVDRIRSEQAGRRREEKLGAADNPAQFDEVAETVETRFEHRAVRDALSELTDLQRESIQLAYYGGYSYPEVAALLGVPLGTIKTRMRDGLIRLRDRLGVAR